uniref:Uncharacterized protein n=1 Tax=Phytophthora ramorum TaxID=164328 RepID=H3GLU8_PHYRM
MSPAPTCEACLSPPRSSAEADALRETDSGALQLKLQALLEMWSEEQPNFRSPALFCETTFKQAKALVSRMPRPDAFLSAVAFACLTQMSSAFDEQYPFLNNVIGEVGAALYSNFAELQLQVELDDQAKHQSALFFERGKPWFQELVDQKMRCQTFQTSADASKNEIRLLTEMLQEARAATSTALSSAAATQGTPSRRETFDEYYIPPALQLGDLSLESLSDEVLKAFTDISDADARHLLALLLENAVEREIPKLPDMVAATVGHMKGQDRREFLRECFDYVTPSELQDALHDRDETNDDKRYQVLVGDLHDLLQLHPQKEDNESSSSPSATVALFHSEEARIGKRVHELIDLVEDVATERLKKEHEIMKRQQADDEDNPQYEDEGAIQVPDVRVENEPQKVDDSKKQKPRRRSTLTRPLSAPSGRRKNAISFNARFGSPRKSSASLHVFPLAEVCHLVSSILHLQFSRDAAESPQVSWTGAVSILTFDERFAFLRQDAAAATFKTLAKDYLVRKYGIKSIAVMYTLQLERSLLHYAAQDNNVRCELFGWFVGADKARGQSKDFAFAFFQRLVKCILSLFAVKKAPRPNSVTSSSQPMSPKPQPLAYSALITMWTECIGDGEPTNLRAIPATLALEACKQVFPPAMQRNSHFTLFREKLYRHSLEQKTIELEEFFRGAMTVWQLVFDGQMQEASNSLETAGALDLDGFARCLITSGLEFTTGERLELFDLLTQDCDESIVPSKKMVHFIMEAKYLTSTALTSS